MAEEEPAEDSLYMDTDDQEASAYLSPQMSIRSKSEYQTVTTSQNSEQFLSISSQICEDNSFDHLDITSEIHEALDEGYIGLDLGTLHRTLPRNLWIRHEQRPQPPPYQPTHEFSRYKQSLKHLIPRRTYKNNKPKELMPLDRAGFFSFITYSWVTRYMKLSYKQGLKAEDIPLCSTNDSCDHSAQRIEFAWKDEVQRNGLKKASLKRVVWKFIRTRVILDIFLYLASLTFGFLGPIFFMRRLLQYCQNPDGVWWEGALWAFGMAMVELFRVLFFGMTWGVAYRTAIRLRAAMITMLYKKVLRLSSLGDKSIGELVNLFANDGQRIYEFATLGPMIVGGPFVAVVGTCYIVWLLGPHALVGMLTFVLFYPVQYAISTLTGYLRRRTIVVTDQRIRLVNELLSCVKLIKMYAWEKPFLKTITDVRKRERFLLEMSAYVQSTSVALTPVVPIIAVIITFLAHIASGHDLTPAEAFTVWCILDTMSIPGYVMPTIVTSYLEMKVTLSRIKSILVMEEIKPCYQKPMDRSIAVALSNCSFCWHAVRNEQKKRKRDSSVRNSGNPKQSEKEVIQPLFNQTVCTLNDINILIPKGRLVGICGTVGAGKSSLLSAILGQMKLEKGTVSVDGSFAYVSQQAWIMNCSLQDNILFGEPFDAKKYYNVIWACALNQDMTTLPAGDQTEIGEKGINLSGGQRQRVALARALYANKDIYFLDDPLSAVDGHVGQHIFEQYIRGALKGKTVFFVTHQLQYLSSCNEVIFMDGGRVIDQGEHATLMNRNELYCTLIQTWLQEKEEVSTIPTNPEIETPIEKTEICSIRRSPVRKMSSSSGAEKNSPEKNNVTKDGDLQSAKQGRLIEEEKVEVGSIPWTTYQIYIQCAGGFLVTFFVMVTFIINIGSTAFSSWWLAHWLNVGVANATRMEGNETIYYKSVRTHPDLEHYQLVYGLFILVILVSSLFRSFFFMKVALRASSLLHNRLFAKIFACPMRFFDSTPVGRILNIFSRDLDETDCRLPSTTEALLQNFLIILVSIIFIVMVLPWFLVALVVLVLVFIFFSRIFRCALRDLKRIENVSRSPIYSHVAATINGLHTVHAFNKEREFISKFMILFDENTSSFFLFNCSMRWLAVRLDFIAVCVMGITAGLVVALHGIIPASMAGLALAYSGQLSGILQYTVRLASETEARFMSVQRMHTYLKTLESEGPAVVEDRRPPDNWPRMGSIRFTNVKMRYRPNLPLVLRNVSFDIEPQEKIGIVGRTGSGKSSLGVCLFRLVEVASGVIKIDGVNILEIGLEDLRSKLSIIPQDPVLFIGSIRYNLDPFNKYSDMAIWEALEQTYMKDKVKLLPAQLESPVVENGENFSVGERQLICMARALLRHSKIILLDEATAAIDAQTDLLVQKTLWKAFKDCTILTIAHRLNTVINCDRILVLEDGKVIEFEKPSILLANCNSVFSGMMKASTSDADGDLLSNAT